MVRSSKTASITALFDYESLEAVQRTIVQQRTSEIRERLRRSAQDIWEIGQKLVDVRSRLKYGQFLTWIKVEFGWSQRTAYNFINVYETFGDRVANLAKVDIATSVLYQLASPSVTDELREEVLEAAKQGQKITARALKSTIKSRKKKQLEGNIADPKGNSSKKHPNGSDIITVIPKSVELISSDQAPLPANVTNLNAVGAALPTSMRLESESWYQLDDQHLIYCGDTASKAFIRQAPFAELAIAITGNDWAHDWLIDQVDNVVVLTKRDFTIEKLEQLLLILSKPRDIVIFPWLPEPEMLSITHRLGRVVYGGDADLEKCRQVILNSGLSIKQGEADVEVHQAG